MRLESGAYKKTDDFVGPVWLLISSKLAYIRLPNSEICAIAARISTVYYIGDLLALRYTNKRLICQWQYATKIIPRYSTLRHEFAQYII